VRIFGKENNQLEAPVRTPGRRRLSTSHSFPPQIFYNPTFNPLYNPLNSYYNRPSGYEYSNFNDDSETANALASDFPEDFKPLDSTPRGSSQPSQPAYGIGLSNISGDGMNFGI
jgi:hypothetical protein